MAKAQEGFFMPAHPQINRPLQKAKKQDAPSLPPPSIEEVWVGYLIRRERQRLGMTQLDLAGELGYGMSSISSLEAGHTFANIRRTFRVLNRLGLDIGLCLAMIQAQNSIHRLLEEDLQKEVKPPPEIRLYRSRPDDASGPAFPDRVGDRPGQGL